jgi:tetratricopeptide (TPR) repeat protein
VRTVARCAACRAFVQTEDRYCWSCGSETKQTIPIAVGERAAPAGVEMDPEAALVMRRAYLAQQRGRLDEAEQLVRGVLERAPDDVPALSMLANLLRAKGDLVGAVSVAQRVSEIAPQTAAPPGAIARAREDRAKIEAQVVRELSGSLASHDSPLAAFSSAGAVWYRSRRFYLALAAAGVLTLFLALVAAMRGHLTGYAWFGLSLFAAGWCYHDAEGRGQAGLFWAAFVLCLGPFGLAIYLLATH